jgi:hypothetical protein
MPIIKTGPLVFGNGVPLGSALNDIKNSLDFLVSTFGHQPNRNIMMFCPMFFGLFNENDYNVGN